MDATALRKEIKAWERLFKTKHLRDPTVEDIKAHPPIGECLFVLFLLAVWLMRQNMCSGEIQAI